MKIENIDNLSIDILIMTSKNCNGMITPKPTPTYPKVRGRVASNSLD